MKKMSSKADYFPEGTEPSVPRMRIEIDEKTGRVNTKRDFYRTEEPKAPETPPLMQEHDKLDRTNIQDAKFRTMGLAFVRDYLKQKHFRKISIINGTSDRDALAALLDAEKNETLRAKIEAKLRGA